MFNDDIVETEIAEELLRSFDLSEVLEMNDLTELEVLTLLIKNGLIGEPERVLARYET